MGREGRKRSVCGFWWLSHGFTANSFGPFCLAGINFHVEANVVGAADKDKVAVVREVGTSRIGRKAEVLKMVQFTDNGKSTQSG